jgi:hypothetical protein
VGCLEYPSPVGKVAATGPKPDEPKRSEVAKVPDEKTPGVESPSRIPDKVAPDAVAKPSAAPRISEPNVTKTPPRSWVERIGEGWLIGGSLLLLGVLLGIVGLCRPGKKQLTPRGGTASPAAEDLPPPIPDEEDVGANIAPLAPSTRSAPSDLKCQPPTAVSISIRKATSIALYGHGSGQFGLPRLGATTS